MTKVPGRQAPIRLPLVVVAQMQTPFQRARVEEVRQHAKTASLAARPELLRLMDSGPFREALRHAVPEVSNASSVELLHSLRREISVAEVCTGVPAAPSSYPGFPPFWWDMTLEEGLTSDELFNQWAVRLSHNGSFGGSEPKKRDSWFETQDDIETRLYGLKPFRTRGAPRSMAETRERAVYTLLNTMRSDACSPLYGDVAFVMSAATVPATIISAIDTGEYAAICNASHAQALGSPFSRWRDAAMDGSKSGLETATARWEWPPYDPNCSAYNFTLGTFEHFDHLLLPNAAYWKVPAPLALARHFELLMRPWRSPLRGGELIHYWEAVVAAQLPFPSSVKFAIGSFPALFGSTRGRKLQAWCARRRWLLVWTLGLNTGRSENYWSIGNSVQRFESNRRLLDPVAALACAHCANATAATPEAAKAFDASWRQVALRRELAPFGLSNETWLSLWNELTGSVDGALQMHPLRASSCADLDQCIGTSHRGADETCVCYKQGGARRRDA